MRWLAILLLHATVTYYAGGEYYTTNDLILNCPTLVSCLYLNRERCTSPPYCGECRPGFAVPRNARLSSSAASLKDVKCTKVPSLTRHVNQALAQRAVMWKRSEEPTKAEVKTTETAQQKEPASKAATTIPPPTRVAGHSALQQPQMSASKQTSLTDNTTILFAVLTAGSVLLLLALSLTVFCVVKHMKRSTALTRPSPYVGAGSTGKVPRNGDTRNAHEVSLRVFDAKKTEILTGGRISPGRGDEQSSSEEETDDHEGVHECPGLAGGGEMDIHNPLFDPRSR